MEEKIPSQKLFAVTNEEKIPMMLTFMFGEAARVAQRGAAERLMGWCRAFDEWLAERGRTHRPSTTKQAVLAWRRLVQQSGKTPWELTQADIEGHAAWMEAEGYSPATTGCALGIFSNFYRWCGERQVDAECGTGFNPAEKARRPKVGRYRGAKLLSREEVGALLRTMQRDASELGKRDYAFSLARLRLGAPLRSLQRVKWGQIEQDPEGRWVRWRAGAERQRLPAEVWEAIQSALAASGRMAGMREGDYIFAPLAEPFKAETGNQASDWLAGKYVSSDQLLRSLKLYGRLAGIPEEKLTLMALRRTAMRLRLEEGASLGEMQVFLDSQEETRFTKYRLSKLPELPGEEGTGVEGDKEYEAPRRKAKPFKAGEGVIHGFYACSQPPQAIKAVLAENIQGIEEQIVGLRILARGLLERQGRARNNQEAAQLGEAYTLAAYRLGELIKAEAELAEGGKSSEWADEFLERLDRAAIERGREAVAEKMRAEAAGLGAPMMAAPGLAAAARGLVEEIASIRYVLRNMFRLAIEAQEAREQIRLGEMYSSGCIRLVHLLRRERADGDQLERYLRDGIDEAIRKVTREWRSSREGGQ